MKPTSLSTAVINRILITAALVLIGATIVMFFVRESMVTSAIANETRQAHSTLEHRIDQSMRIGELGAVSFVNLPGIIKDFDNKDHASLRDRFAQVADKYKQDTAFKNITFLLVDSEGKFLMRTYAKEPDSGRGKDATYRGGVSDILAGKKTTHSAVDLSSGGIVIGSFAGVEKDGKRIGALEFRSGFGNINDDMLVRNYFHVILVNDLALKTFKKGAENTQYGKYHIAHNTQFRKPSQDWLKQFDVDALVDAGMIQTNQTRADVYPITNAQNEVIAYHVVGYNLSVLDEQFAHIDSIFMQVGLVITGLIALLLLVLFVSLQQLVKRPLNTMKDAINSMSTQGTLNKQLVSQRNDEVGQMSQALNHLFGQTHQALQEANQVVQAIAQNNYQKRMQGTYVGDLNELKEGINGSAKSVAFMMDELGKVMDGLSHGALNLKMSDQVPEAFRNQVNGAFSMLNDVVHNITAVMQKMQQGDFASRVNVNAPGQLGQLKDSMNASLDSLALAISEISRVLQAQASGDLTPRIDTPFNGQLQILQNALNNSNDRLLEVVNNAIVSAQQVQNSAQEVSQGAQDLNERVQQQAAALEETSATMEQMNASLQSGTQNIQEVSQVMQGVESKAQTGAKVMNDTITAMNSIEQSSHQIADIVTLIDSIAFQTNLLALNAAVEAARAGEQGRGFAVVAGEVRSLAQKSADAARNIKTLIDESVAKITQGTRLADESGRMLNEINLNIKDTSQRMQQIAAGSHEQALGISQVHTAITQMDSVTQQNAALVEETTAAAESMTEVAGQLSQDMAFFRPQSGALKRLN
ncbi:methyl-accepting chemotaxis protein [Thiomicrorhabdus aquaedulcis]|uniref:methyl-accepting chemotaxis protein n=1 Tax=Thiomicrorhabdus aquaedulcis TaxID=2211106 RepID=UPI000FD8B430|nr:methyl-accepting chemotaxis protein [Thiomicrorhabdus aquaedulcis]